VTRRGLLEFRLLSLPLFTRVRGRRILRRRYAPSFGLVSDCASPTTCRLAAHKDALRCVQTPTERIESLRPALRFRVLRGGTDTDEREVVRYMGGASRADRYRLLVAHASWDNALRSGPCPPA
jgi:hypothetical protein